MQCPRCQAELAPHQKFHGIEVELCASCGGRWLDSHELDDLEATTASTPEERRATIRYSQRPSELQCPVCGNTMAMFNYRAYNLELDACDEHGYWLDAGEEGRVREIVEERVRDLARSQRAEDAWAGFMRGLRRKR